MNCSHEWLLKEGMDNIPCFGCGFYPTISKRGTYKTCRCQICNLCLKQLFNISIPDTHMVQGSTHNLLLETWVYVLETRLSLLETELANLQQIFKDQKDPKGKRSFDREEDIDMVLSKTPNICNTECSIDIRVQCTLNIQGHELTLHAFLDSGATQSTIDEAILLSFLLATLIKITNSPLVSTQFDGQKLSCSKFVNCEMSPSVILNQLWVWPLHQ